MHGPVPIFNRSAAHKSKSETASLYFSLFACTLSYKGEIQCNCIRPKPMCHKALQEPQLKTGTRRTVSIIVNANILHVSSHYVSKMHFKEAKRRV